MKAAPHTNLSTTSKETLLPVRPPYNLIRTLSCGQAFRWRPNGAHAVGVFAGRLVRLEQSPDGIVVEGLAGPRAMAGLSRYLGLNQPLARIEGRLRRDRVLARILPQTSGIAILRQDPWECLASFIVSAFNNIPKIEMTVARLSERFGEPLPGGGHAFPHPAALAGAAERALRGCILGYRAPYLRAAAGLVTTGAFDLLAPFALPYDEAKRMLLKLPGVGDKVADCVLLFAYGKGEAFPVDVWVKRAVEHWYFRGAQRSERDIRTFAAGRFGDLAGYAQQHIFYYRRFKVTE